MHNKSADQNTLRSFQCTSGFTQRIAEADEALIRVGVMEAVRALTAGSAACEIAATQRDVRHILDTFYALAQAVVSVHGLLIDCIRILLASDNQMSELVAGFIMSCLLRKATATEMVHAFVTTCDFCGALGEENCPPHAHAVMNTLWLHMQRELGDCGACLPAIGDVRMQESTVSAQADITKMQL